MIVTEQILKETYPNFKVGRENKLVLNSFKKLLHEDDCNQVIRNNQHLSGYAFLDKLLSDMNFSYEIAQGSPQNIPANGRLLIVANHPIGTLDGLAVIQFIRTIRPDVRIVANSLLLKIEPLKSVFLPVEVLTDKKSLRDSYKGMLTALHNEEALIIFPAGEVSRITPLGVRDGAWQTGFIKLAKKTQTNIIPIHIAAKNSVLFYSMSTLYKPLGTVMLFKEMFNKYNQIIKFSIGSAIPYQTIADSAASDLELSQLIRKYVLSLCKNVNLPFFDSN